MSSAPGASFSGPGGLTYVALSKSWIIINSGGGPTDDKPEVTLETPRDPDRVSSFLNIRVKDIATAATSATPTATWSKSGRPPTSTAAGTRPAGRRRRPPPSPSHRFIRPGEAQRPG
jgi:hypothetical protein